MTDDDLDTAEFWDELLAYIEERRVVPVIGPGLVNVEIDGVAQPLMHVLALRLAERLRVDVGALTANPSLNDVASAFVARGGRREEIYPKIRLLLRDLNPKPAAALSQLAAIPGFELFVSLTFDGLLGEALNQARFAGEPHTLQLAFSPSRADDLPRDWAMTRQPVVYHLLGKLSAAPEYAVTDEDVLEFVTSLQSEVKRPNLLFDELRGGHLLVIGAAFPDWLARFFLRAAKNRQLSLARSEREIIVDPVAASDPHLVSFVRNFSYGTRLVGFEPGAFVAELHQRWVAAGHALATPATAPASVAGPSTASTASVMEPSATAPRPSAAPAVVAGEPRESMLPGSVFLSYAKEDLQHVLALKAALDRAGVEAWLDKERLEAGDMYDQKIRRFIKTCGAFVPVISRNTERRMEGYFRKEWKLASERAQGIAEHIPFILPVVVDDTPEYGASVPENFLVAQWTRLVNGQSGGEFEQRLAKLVAEYRRREGIAA